jgi:hypothetical protein
MYGGFFASGPDVNRDVAALQASARRLPRLLGMRDEPIAIRGVLRVGAGMLLALSIGCGHGRMVPGPSARVIPDAPNFAVVEHDGLRVSASGDDWNVPPEDLGTVLSPVRVRIVNHTGHSLRLLLGRFSLVGAHGRVYRPLPPIPLFHESPQDALGVVRPYFVPASFFVRVAYRDVYPSIPPWPVRLAADDQFYQQQYALWSEGLPTREMQRRALPEGVLADGGEIAGFVYFENATRREGKLSLKIDLRDGDSDAEVTSAAIPFRVE